MKALKKVLPLFLAFIVIVTAASCGGKTTTDAYFGSIRGSDFLTDYIDNGTGRDHVLSGFEFTEKGFENKFVNGDERWFGASVDVLFTNKNDFGINVLGLTADDGGDKKLYICKFGDAVMGLPEKYDGYYTMTFNIIASAEKYSLSTVYDGLKQLNAELIYVDSATEIDDLKNAAESDLIYEKIRMAEKSDFSLETTAPTAQTLTTKKVDDITSATETKADSGATSSTKKDKGVTAAASSKASSTKKPVKAG
ncbi:MAG: hypothetical protein K6F09_08880 [Clostridiales bacterium]|nr:hypothetical protein [Clostridiales bacterium]